MKTMAIREIRENAPAGGARHHAPRRRLMAQMTGQPKFPLFAESENHFFLKVVDAQLEFARNAAGAITSVTLHQGPATTQAQKK